MRGLCFAAVWASVVRAVLAQGVSQPVCSPDHSHCTACHACCFDMDTTTCESCVASECPAAPTPAPLPHRCVGDCNACDQCCKPFLVDPAACASCVAAECSSAATSDSSPAGAPGSVSEPEPESNRVRADTAPVVATAVFDCTLPREMQSTCVTSLDDPDRQDDALTHDEVSVRKKCFEQCWAPWSPCLRRPAPHDPCPSTVHLLLMIAVIVPYCGRVVGEYLFGFIVGGLNGRDSHTTHTGGYNELDGTLEGMDDHHRLNKRVSVSKAEPCEYRVMKDVTYAYSAEVLGGKDCKIGLTFEGSSPRRLQRAERKQSVMGEFTPHENGRLVFTFDNTYSWYYDKTIQVNINAREWPRPPDRGVHMSYICRQGPQEFANGSHWDEARKYLNMSHGLTESGAYARSVGRLIFWHVLQPCAYFAAFRTVSYQLDWLQYILGALVGVREMIYLVVTFAAVVKNPTFLLIDIGACYTDRNATGKDSETKIMNGGPTFLLMYTCMPEKMVERALFSKGGVGRAAASPVKVVSALFDLVGCSALFYGVARGVLPPVLAVSYSMTALGGVAMLIEIATGTARQQTNPWNGITGMGGTGGGPPYTGAEGSGGQLSRMESTMINRTVSPQGSPRSPRSRALSGQEDRYEPVEVWSKTHGKWCDGHVVNVSSPLKPRVICLSGQETTVCGSTMTNNGPKTLLSTAVRFST